MRGAALGIASRCYDLVLAIGVEKLKDTGYGGLGEAYPGKWEPIYGALGTPPGRYALSATAYFAKYGFSQEEGKRMLAEISVKSHYYGMRNPKAHLKMEITVEEAMNAPMICWPLGLFDCCGVTDGASAAVLVPSSEAKAYRDDYVNIKAFSIATGPGFLKEDERYDFTYWRETQEGAKAASEEAGPDQKVEQGRDRRRHRRHVGHGRRVEDLVHPATFVDSDDTLLNHQRLGPI